MPMLTLEQVKGFLLPELEKINSEQQHIRERLTSMEQHLVDQSRRIDETNHRIDALREEMVGELRQTNNRVDALREEMVGELRQTNHRIDETNHRIDETNDRLNRLYEVVVRRDEHNGLENRMVYLEQEVQGLKLRLAA